MNNSYVGQVRLFLGRRLAEGRPVSSREEIEAGIRALPEEWPKLKVALRHLSSRGELKPEGTGFRYLPAAEPDKIADRIYRVARAQKGVFTAEEIASLAETGIRPVVVALGSLERQGYLKKANRNRDTRLWLMTQLGRETPAPPHVGNGYAEWLPERQAVARLAEVFLTAQNLNAPRTVGFIRESLEILNRRFGKQRKEAKNGA